MKRDGFFSLCLLGTKSWTKIKQWKFFLEAGKVFSIVVMIRLEADSPRKSWNLIYWRTVRRDYTKNSPQVLQNWLHLPGGELCTTGIHKKKFSIGKKKKKAFCIYNVF